METAAETENELNKVTKATLSPRKCDFVVAKTDEEIAKQLALARVPYNEDFKRAYQNGVQFKICSNEIGSPVAECKTKALTSLLRAFVLRSATGDESSKQRALPRPPLERPPPLTSPTKGTQSTEAVKLPHGQKNSKLRKDTAECSPSLSQVQPSSSSAANSSPCNTVTSPQRGLAEKLRNMQMTQLSRNTELIEKYENCLKEFEGKRRENTMKSTPDLAQDWILSSRDTKASAVPDMKPTSQRSNGKLLTNMIESSSSHRSGEALAEPDKKLHTNQKKPLHSLPENLSSSWPRRKPNTKKTTKADIGMPQDFKHLRDDNFVISEDNSRFFCDFINTHGNPGEDKLQNKTPSSNVEPCAPTPGWAITNVIPEGYPSVHSAEDLNETHLGLPNVNAKTIPIPAPRTKVAGNHCVNTQCLPQKYPKIYPRLDILNESPPQQ
ncbi:hypothetical protein O0L34_g11850 [Tuta absoluta]|nr:hypothetical protein O0L34_g11850 [Tuta absoluta]